MFVNSKINYLHCTNHFMPVLSIDHLTKHYGAVRALNDVSFKVEAGTVFGILGPNGSGKTTLLGIVMDVLKATSGTYTWLDKPYEDSIRKQIGTLLETPNFYHYLSGEDNLRIASRIKGRGEENIAKVLQLVNLHQRKDSKFNTYSLGMKQRLAIASCLLGDPDILVFDEPTNGLDPAGIAEIRELIRQLNRSGKTIIMASHILDEVEKVCTHVAIIQQGVLKTYGPVSAIMHPQEAGATTKLLIEVGAGNNAQLKSMLSQLNGVETVSEEEDGLLITCAETLSPEMVNEYCFKQGIVLNKLSLKRKSLETRFLEITGNKSDR